MWLPNPINHSRSFVVRRFDLIVAIAKVMKNCHTFYVSAEFHTLLGVCDSAYGVREMVIPQSIPIEKSFIFRLDVMTTDVVNRWIDFVVCEEMPFVAIPLAMNDRVPYLKPIFAPSSAWKLWKIVDTSTNEEIEVVDLYDPDGAKSSVIMGAKQFLDSYIQTRPIYTNPIMFHNLQADPTVRFVFDSKTSIGEQYLCLEHPRRKYGLFICKPMFSLNKQDKLDVCILDCAVNPTKFEAQFKVHHAKNPIKYLIPEGFDEITHVSYIHLM